MGSEPKYKVTDKVKRACRPSGDVSTVLSVQFKPGAECQYLVRFSICNNWFLESELIPATDQMRSGENE